jgi:HlyD family secretion protein
MKANQQKMRTNFRRPAIAGLALIAVLMGAGATWASLAKVSSAVIATGTVGVSGKPKTIQHLDGGIVEKINIEAGQTVRQGEQLIEIDDKTVLANLNIYRGRLGDLVVRKGRLQAELEGKSEVPAPDPSLVAKYRLENISTAITQQKAVLVARRSTIDGEVSQLDERISQFKQQIKGVEGLRTSKEKQMVVYQKERASIEKLVNEALAAKNQLLAYDRSFADLGGQMAEHNSEIGRLKNSISEVEVTKLQVVRNFNEKVITELDEIDSKISELIQQVDATEQQLDRTIIKSPVDGIIHELSIFTIGGVIQPGQPIMQIVPLTQKLEIEINVDAQSIDQVSPGQKTVIRFPSFSQRTTPELYGEVARVSPTSVVDEKTGFTFYRVGVALTESELRRLGDKVIVPGMPIEAVIPTKERTVIEYLVKPLTDNLTHVFREE